MFIYSKVRLNTKGVITIDKYEIIITNYNFPTFQVLFKNYYFQ